MSTTLDRIADACLALSMRCLTLRDRLFPSESPSYPDADVLLAGILARLGQPLYQPSEDDIAAALLAQATGKTIWIQRTPFGTRAAACGEPS